MKGAREEHLRPEDFFLLAFPPSGEPEALPPHLSGCSRCGRQLAQWRAAAEGLAAPTADAPDDFERTVMAKLRSMRSPRSRRPRRRRIAGIAAAACLLAAFGLGVRLGRRSQPASGQPEAAAAASIRAIHSIPSVQTLSAEDRTDDELLRDVSRLVSGDDEENNWKSLAPMPAAPGGNS